MADSILRLKVESSEYDTKLKKAAEGIRHLADVAHKGGGELTGLEKSELDYIKALGDMETKSRTASGQVRELTGTYKELKVVYDQLNDVEKADEGGKALAASLDRLRQRAQEAKSSLDNASKSLETQGGLLDILKDKMVINIDAMKLFNVGLSAAKVALDVVKDAFFANESTVDEWGRVMDSSKSLYEGFLTALNTGDISGYLSRIDEIVSAARTAYNEIDRLGTMKTIQAPRISAQQTENDRMRMMIQTGRYIAPVDGRRATMADGQKLTKEQIQRIEQQLQNGMKTIVGLVSNEVKQTGRAIDAVYRRQAAELGMNLKEFRAGTSSMAEFDKRIQGYDNYQKWRASHTTIDQQSGREIVARGNPFEQFAKWGVFRVDGDRYNDLVKLIQQRDQQAAQAYGMQGQAYRTMNRAEGVTVRSIMSGGTGDGGSTTSPVPVKIEAFDANKAALSATKGVDTMPSVWSMLGDQGLRDMLGIGAQQWDYNKVTKEATGEDIYKNLKDNDKETGKLTTELGEVGDKMSTFASGLSSIASGFKGLGIDLPKGVDEAINVIQSLCSIIQGVNTVISVFSASAMTANTAAIMANTAALTTNSVLQFWPFAGGGIVPHAANGTVAGSHFSGDVTPIMANAGEVVLNKAQTNHLANELTTRDNGSGGNGRPYVDGETIYLGLSAYLKSTGRGEIMTSRFK